MILLIGIVFIIKPDEARLQVFMQNNGYTLKYNLADGYVKYNGVKYNLVSDHENSVIDIAVADIDSDGRDNILILEGKKNADYAERLVLYDLSYVRNKFDIKKIYTNTIGSIKPWKLKVCEIDGDENPDIFMIVNKVTQESSELQNRPFFFNFEDHKLVKKWTGSKLRYPFIDACFGDLDGNGTDEFIVIEKVKEDKFIISDYYWFGFGFILQAESKIYDGVDSIEIEKKDNVRLKARIKEGNVVKYVSLELLSERTENAIYLLGERGN